MLTEISNQHLNTIKVWYLVQHSLTAFHQVKQYFGSLDCAVTPQNLLQWHHIPIHKNHIHRAQNFNQSVEQEQFKKCLNVIQQQCDFICIPDDPSYPQQLLPYVDHPPILFGQGNITLLNQAQIALVGSRKASKNGLQTTYDFAYYLAEKGFIITSGLAEGVDTASHQAALCIGQTIAVMATGIDQTYPKRNTALRQQIIQQYSTVITEFLPFTPPLKQYFPRRNRIVSGLSLGVLVTEASLNSGSLITARLAAEQGKTIFSIPGHIHSQFHQGCHHLIREGAILVDHPDQLIEDLSLATEWQLSTHSSLRIDEYADIPQHLHMLYQSLDWHGKDIDILSSLTQLAIPDLLIQLMELELLGHCVQEYGLYLRCKNLIKS